ncbi:putative beta-carotene-binding protein [Episyrphus balteatus]|uniref:putative beta-carotene-binding protein n=1 Tax=Episyrphus balteatus TaxID=286459 RepID=UPI002485498F|nr:putative beta-carotene-binding protein [Episyrphus balteatus]
MKLIILQVALLCAVAYVASVPLDADSSEKSSEGAEFVLPSGIPTCSADEEKLNECLKDVFQQMLPKLHHGNKELKIPPIDPFALQNTKYDYSNGILSGRVGLKDTKVYGLSRSEVKDVNFKLTEDGTHMEINIFTPRIYVEGNYKADMKINDVRMNPKGYFNVTMSGLNISETMDGKFEVKNGQRFLRMTNFDMDVDIEDMKIYANGLFPDPTLNAIVLDFINQYWREIYKVIIPETRSYWEPLALSAMNEFMLNVPFDKLITKTKN